MRKLVVLVVIALGLLLLIPAVASASTPTLKSLAKSLAALQKTVRHQATAITTLNRDLASAKQATATQGSTLATMSGELAQARADIAALQNTPPSGVSQTDFDALAAKVTAAQSDIGGLQSVIGADSSHGLQLAVANLQGGLSGLATTVAGHTTSITGLQTSVSGLQNTVTSHADVLSLEPYLTVTPNSVNGVAGPNITFHDANVHVQGATGSGQGNLIVGYDDEPSGTLPSPFRDGSNNLVCGDFNNFTSHGCFVAGEANTAAGPFSSVSGGLDCKVTGNCGVIGGGYNFTSVYWWEARVAGSSDGTSVFGDLGVNSN